MEKREPYCKCLYEIENNLDRSKFCFIPCQDQRKILFKSSALEWWKDLTDSKKAELCLQYNITNPTEDDSLEIYKKEMRTKMVENIKKGNHGL